jgi:hypothetical protein
MLHCKLQVNFLYGFTKTKPSWSPIIFCLSSNYLTKQVSGYCDYFTTGQLNFGVSFFLLKTSIFVMVEIINLHLMLTSLIIRRPDK